MKIEDQVLPAMKKVAELIKDVRTVMLTSSEPGHLHSRPMTPLKLEADGSVWMFTSRDAFEGVPGNVNLAFADHDHGSYVSLEGAAQLVDDRQRIHELWTLAAKPWFPDGPDSPDLILLKVETHEVAYWDSPGSKVVRALAMAASVVAGKPVGLGEHGSANVTRQ